MKLVKIRSLGDLMITGNIWKTGQKGNIEHEEYGGTITTEMMNKEYVIDVEHDLLIHDDDAIETVMIHHKLTGSVPHNILLYGWMVDDLGKYVPSIEEIINNM